MKIVGIGLNKTGTSTLGECFEHWGLKHVSYSAEAFDLWRENRLDELLGWVERYESFEDWPWPLIYREIDERFAGSKFILTRRRSPDAWFRSLCKHAEHTGPTAFRHRIFGHDMPHDHRDDHVSVYERHLKEVRAYFRERPGDLLEVCWEEGHGWDELAGFLGYERPEIPFPHANRGKQDPKGLRGLKAKLFKK